jgi:hypothetical protein
MPGSPIGRKYIAKEVYGQCPTSARRAPENHPGNNSKSTVNQLSTENFTQLKVIAGTCEFALALRHRRLL